MPTPAELADRFAAALLARETDNSESVNHTVEITQESLTAAAKRSTPDGKNELVRELAKHLAASCPPREFGIIANTAGVIVEWGADPGIALPAILDRMLSMFAGVPAMAEKLEHHFGTANLEMVPVEKWRPIAEASPDASVAVREFMSLQFAGCAAMTMLARRPELRIEARKRTELVANAEAACDDNPYAYYISEVLGMTDGEELLVIDIPRKLGFRVLLTGVRNNFHLFTLLQGELLNHPTAAEWTGSRPHPLPVALARAERMASDIPQAEWKAFTGPTGQGYDRAIWTYYQWNAMQPDGSLQLQTQVPKGELPRWVWGEMKPTSIPALDGQRVVLLGPLEVARSWGINFFMPVHPDLRSSTKVTAVLDAAEVERWLERLRAGK